MHPRSQNATPAPAAHRAGGPGVKGALRPGSILTLILLLAGCGSDEEAGRPPGKRPSRDHLVTIFTAERERIATHHQYPGSLRFRRLVRIHNREEGRIIELEVFEGDRVAQGDLLVRLEDDLLRAQLDKARATKRQKQLDLRRQEGLKSKRAVSEDTLAQARTALAVAQAEQQLLETRLAYTDIHAPFTGVVTERHVEPGDFVAKNNHLLTLADPASLVAEVHASELILPWLGLGDPADIRIDALGTARFRGKILRIHPTLTQTSRQAVVEIVMTSIPERARAGQSIRATLSSAAAYRILAPLRAVRRDREGEFLWLLNDQNQIQRRAIRTGLHIGDRIEILEGLEPGERLVTRGFLGLTPGKQVQIVPDDNL